MLGAVARRREQGEHQIDRAIVDGVIGDRRVETDEHRLDAVQTGQARMRHRDARTETGRAQGFTLHEGVKDANFVLAHGLRGRGGEHVQGLPLR